MSSRRAALAKWMDRTGALRLLESLPLGGQLIVVNYHRIGRRAETQFDPEVFSADTDVLDGQIAALKRQYAIIGEAEALDLISARRPSRGRAILLTFDDGYLDNLTLAVPVLRSHGVNALFFLVTSYLDDPMQVPWWDRIAWQVRRCMGRELVLSAPEPLSVVIDATNVTRTIREVLRRYRSPRVQDPAAFLAELTRCANGLGTIPAEKLLMDWADAAELLRLGMTIGGHTHSNLMLARLDVEEQRSELVRSRELLQSRLGIRVRSLAYPVGSPDAFTSTTKRLAKEVGYEVAFSFYGGTNMARRIDPHDVRRIALSDDAGVIQARAAVALLASTQRSWL